MLMVEIPNNHLGCINACKWWDIYHISRWSPDFWTINSTQWIVEILSWEVSVEMIEAVGHDFMPGYFGAFDECLVLLSQDANFRFFEVDLFCYWNFPDIFVSILFFCHSPMQWVCSLSISKTSLVFFHHIERIRTDSWILHRTRFHRCLKPGGKVAIQAICIPDERYESYRSNGVGPTGPTGPTWILGGGYEWQSIAIGTMFLHNIWQISWSGRNDQQIWWMRLNESVG